MASRDIRSRVSLGGAPQWGYRQVGSQITQNTNQVQTQQVSAITPLTSGTFPDHSKHWEHYFSNRMYTSPLGDKPSDLPRINPQIVHQLVTDRANDATAGSHDVWDNYHQLTQGPMMWNGSHPELH